MNGIIESVFIFIIGLIIVNVGWIIRMRWNEPIPWPNIKKDLVFVNVIFLLVFIIYQLYKGFR